MEDTKDAKEKFLRSYADLIESLREEIIIVINGKPYTWNSAYFEIKNNTPLSKKILNSLKNIGVI